MEWKKKERGEKDCIFSVAESSISFGLALKFEFSKSRKILELLKDSLGGHSNVIFEVITHFCAAKNQFDKAL